MVDPIVAAVVAAGVVILLAGAALSIYGVALLGAIVGGGSGLLLAPELGFEATGEIAAAGAVGVLAGIIITYLVLTIAIAILAFAVGAHIGANSAEYLFTDPGTALVIVTALIAGIVAGFLATFLTRTVMVLITAFVGAALASRQLTIDDITDIDLFFAIDDPLFLGLFVLGVLSQFGLFKLGWVAKIALLLPGASVFSDKKNK